MIPPASERAVRPCYRCIFYLESYGSPYCRYHEIPRSDIRGGAYEKRPCDENYTIDELQELIAQHNQQEQQPHQEGSDK